MRNRVVACALFVFAACRANALAPEAPKEPEPRPAEQAVTESPRPSLSRIVQARKGSGMRDFDEWQPGDRLTLGLDTPMMPYHTPPNGDVAAWMARITKLSPGADVQVVERAEVRGTVWYRVSAFANTGWINSMALNRPGAARVD